MTIERRRIRNAQAAARYAIKTGRLVRQPCVICGDEPTDGHHEDYAAPLVVVWLCRMHHVWRHRYGYTVAQMSAEERRAA